MRWKSSSGLTLVELIVVVSVLLVAAFVITPCISNAPLQANMTAVGSRGRDIYVAIERANAERKALGLPPLWPRNSNRAADTNVEELARLDFTTSTAYFKWLIDEQNLNTPQWSPRVTGVDYSMFAGAGVPACADRKLTATNNLWTVAKNVRPDMDDLIPVLVTRNIDASSLATRVVEGDFKTKSLRFDPNWEIPFGDKVYVMIRKGGGVFKARRKYMSYDVVYQTHIFDTTHASDGFTKPLLKYLTPTREVVPDEQTYADGAAIAYQLAGGWRGKVKREAKCIVELFAPVLPGAIMFAFVYLAYFARGLMKRREPRLCHTTSAPVIGVWICHYLAVTFYAVGLVGAGGDGSWVYAVVALAAQAVGIGLVLVFQRKDREARRRQIKWLLVPLWVVLICMTVMSFLMLGVLV